MEKATAEMLIAKKLQGEYDKMKIKTVNVGSLGFSLELRKPGIQKVLELLDEAQQDDSMMGNIRFEEKLVYESCKMLHDKKLMEEFECTEPPDIVLKILDENMEELDKLSGIVLGFYGLNELDDKVKN